jgi:hypothetical protein
MAVRVFCAQPQKLLLEIKAAVRSGSIQTWTLDTDGDFTHATQQWANKAWFRPVTKTDRVVFNILGPTTKRMSRQIYGIYHGRFVEMLLNHFDEKFSIVAATALPDDGDWVGGPTP